MICLIDPESSVRLRILGRNRPGATPCNDYLDAELVITSAFTGGRLGLRLSPEAMDDWPTALNELSSGQDIRWPVIDVPPGCLADMHLTAARVLVRVRHELRDGRDAVPARSRRPSCTRGGRHSQQVQRAPQAGGRQYPNRRRRVRDGPTRTQAGQPRSETGARVTKALPHKANATDCYSLSGDGPDHGRVAGSGDRQAQPRSRNGRSLIKPSISRILNICERYSRQSQKYGQ
ncbi:DUF5959 family protein [Streptomyces sp. NPDC058739]|uniref:DUF5959 family protein n=1 Tax=Streptomyces sp. NPDC058739 TaxID=3346618 RepID=UPI00369FA54F